MSEQYFECPHCRRQTARIINYGYQFHPDAPPFRYQCTHPCCCAEGSFKLTPEAARAEAKRLCKAQDYMQSKRGYAEYLEVKTDGPPDVGARCFVEPLGDTPFAAVLEEFGDAESGFELMWVDAIEGQPTSVEGTDKYICLVDHVVRRRPLPPEGEE